MSINRRQIIYSVAGCFVANRLYNSWCFFVFGIIGYVIGAWRNREVYVVTHKTLRKCAWAWVSLRFWPSTPKLSPRAKTLKQGLFRGSGVVEMPGGRHSKVYAFQIQNVLTWMQHHWDLIPCGQHCLLEEKKQTLSSVVPCFFLSPYQFLKAWGLREVEKCKHEVWFVLVCKPTKMFREKCTNNV